MAGDLNQVTIIGRLTRDSEIRHSQAGAIVRFSIAVNRRKRNADGTYEDEANFFNCVYFGKGAEGVNQYLTRGRQVAINGELRQNRYEIDGQARQSVEIFVRDLQLLQQSQNSQASSSSSSSFTRDSSYERTPFENRSRLQSQSSAKAQPKLDSFDNFSEDGPENYGDDSIPF